MDKQILKLLNESFDRDLSPQERAHLNSALQASPGLREEQKRLLKVRNLLAAHEAGFKTGFSDFVMAGVSEEKRSLKLRGIAAPFNRIALPLLAAAAVLLLFTLLTNGSLSIDAVMGIDQLEPEYLSEFLLFNY
jgi:hypothetical protein